MEALRYHEFAPPADLGAAIECIWLMEADGALPDAPPERILADGCMEIVFNLADRFRRP